MYHIIINPASRSGEGRRLWSEAEPLFQESGRDYQVYFSSEEQSIRRLAEEITANSEAADLVVMGGDGTLNEVLNGIRDFSKVRIGLIPTGSGNDFARDAGISKNIREAAASVLRDDNHRSLDLGVIRWKSCGLGESNVEAQNCGLNKILAEAPVSDSVQERRFLISTGIGFDAQICFEADHSRWKKLLNKLHIGKLIYILVAIRLILTAVRAELTLKITADTEAGSAEPAILHFNDCLFAVCMNHRLEGGGFRFAPDASPTDGQLDVCVASGISRPRFFALFPLAYSGAHVNKRGVHVFKGSRISIESDIPLHIHTDGEVPDRAREVEVLVLPGAVRFLN